MKPFDIQNYLAMRCWDRRHIMTVPNCSSIGYEADVLSVTQRLLVHEFEIKVSSSDFRADFKNKHHKHWRMGELFKEQEANTRYAPNYFWFVAPEGLLTLEQLPDYAGLIAVRSEEQNTLFGKLRVAGKTLREAPRLHKDKIEPVMLERVTTALKTRYWSMRIKNADLEYVEKLLEPQVAHES